MADVAGVDTVGPWARDKLALLRKYLEAYTAIMSRESWCRNGYHYIDAFAGGGRPLVRDTLEYIDGSPRVALQVERPFTSYRFIEQEPWRVGQLEGLRREFPQHRITIDQGDCNAVLAGRVARDIRYERFNRGLVFLDPFTMNVEWETVQALAATRALEVFINSPVMALNRTVLVNNPALLTKDKRDRMNRFWGSEAWLDAVYRKQPTLFGDERLVKVHQRGKALGRLFKARLGEAFAHVSEPVVMANSNNAPLYHLLFAGHNPTGCKIVNDIFERFERTGA